MDVETVSLPRARLSAERNGVRFVHCPNCDRKAAHVVGDRLVFESGGIRLTCSVVANPVVTCFKCGAPSVVRLA